MPIHQMFLAGSRHIVSLSDFDGTNDYLTRGADLTGAADGKAGTTSLWFSSADTAGGAVRIFNNDTAGAKFNALINTSGNIQITGRNAAGTIILALTSTGIAVDDDALHHLMASWNLATAAGHLYIDGVDRIAGSPTLTNDTIDYTTGGFSIGANPDGSGKLNGKLGQLYINTAEYVDLSTAGAKFWIGEPVNLGAAGAIPTGTAPIVFINNVYTSFETNLGTGGGFTESGALGDGGTYP